MKRGDIVLAHFPHASGTPAKRRPSLVVQADFYNQRLSNVLLASITSNLSRRADPAHYFIDVVTAEGKLSGLRHNSLVSCLNLAVLPMPLAGIKIGELPSSAMLHIDACLKAALGIP
jgi:mRNA interferase MazF